MNVRPAPTSAREPYDPRPHGPPTGKIVKKTVTLTLTGEVTGGDPPAPGSLTWVQRLSRNVGLGTVAGIGAAYVTGCGLLVLLGLGAGAAISARDKRA